MDKMRSAKSGAAEPGGGSIPPGRAHHEEDRALLFRGLMHCLPLALALWSLAAVVAWLMLHLE